MENILSKLRVCLVMMLALSCVQNTVASEINESNLINIEINKSDFTGMHFIPRVYGTDDFESSLAMNIAYEPILKLRKLIEENFSSIDKLKYLKSWNPKGEAHITTITPVEFQKCMTSSVRGINIISMAEITDIASEYKIQQSSFNIVGIGSGTKSLGESGMLNETFYIVVESDNLMDLRKAVYARYLEKGGESDCWDPESFFPHITIGYTHSDIHYPELRKDLTSLDSRFNLKLN